MTSNARSDRPLAILLARLSDNRDDVDLTDEGIPLSLEDQVQRMRERANELGWQVWKVIKNPRLSAYKRRKVTLPDGRREYRVWRPDLREALGDLASGRANRLLCLDLDRAFRDPKDLQDLIDVVEHAPHRIVVESVTGSLHMEKGRDNFDAEIRVLVANKSSRDTARRVAAARERQAMHGQYGGGKRPFGFCHGAPQVAAGADPDTVVCPWHGGRWCRSGVTTIPAEVDVVADCSRRLLDGATLRGMAAELRTGGVGTVSGSPWTAQALRELLLRPRNAGLIVYRDQIVEGVSAPWEPIISREVFEAVRDMLTDPNRRTTPGAAPRWHGSGIYRCGICTPPGTDTDRPMTCQVTVKHRDPQYKCREFHHLARNAAYVDRVVFAHVLYALTHPRAFELLAAPPPDIDADALRAERAAIRATMERYAVEEMLQQRTPAQVAAATRAGLARIGEIDALLHATVGLDPLAALVNAADPVQAWANLELADQRLFIDRLCTVTILPAARRGRVFDPTAVHIAPKHRLGSGEALDHTAPATLPAQP
jgi:DNA invertase Pin-like site-specific DNA recombinase